MNNRRLGGFSGGVLLSLVLGTIILYFTDNEIDTICALLCAPMVAPNLCECGLVRPENENIILPYKLAKLNSRGFDLSLRWYIEFSAWSFSENKLVRKRLYSVNSIDSIDGRKVYSHNVIKELNKALEAGYSFDKLKSEKEKTIISQNKIVKHISIKDYLLNAVEANKNRYNGRSYGDIKGSVLKFNEFITENNLTYLGFKDLEKINAVAYQKYLVKKNYAGKTINCRMSTISTFYNEYNQENKLIINPFDGIKRIKEVKTSINKAFNEVEIQKLKILLKDNHPSIWLACMLMYYCFLRPNEIRQLRIKHFNLSTKKIYVNSIISKNKKSFSIDIPGPLIELIEKQINNETDTEKYIITACGSPSSLMCGRNTLRDKYEKIVKDLNLDKDLTFYSFKHSGVVRAYEAGIDIKAIQLHGRWHSIDMMDKYLKSLGLIENKNFTSVMNNQTI